MKEMNSDFKILIEILDAREARANRQNELLKKYPYTLISFTLNTPGAIKNSNLYSKIHKEGMDYLLATLLEMNITIVHIETIDKSTGKEGFISLDIDAVKMKKMTVNIENTHYLGRLFDFDVFDANYNQINRSNLKLEARKCLICDEDALNCIRLKSHSYGELISKAEEIGVSYFKLMEENKANKLKSKVSMSNTVYLKIKEDIINNRLKPGEKLVEENLAEEFCVSRTPIREALKQLDKDGLVTYYPRRGSFVSEISINDLQELYDVREVLEGLAIKHICMNIGSQNIKLLENIVANMDEAIKVGDFDQMKSLHKEWTEATLFLTKNSLLKNYLIAVTKNLVRLRKISLHEPEQSLDAYKETKDILNAIVKNDPEESERLARLHVKNARMRFEKNLIKL